MKRRKLLSGNYKPAKEPEAEMPSEQEDFEKAALAKLGGSVAFVRGRKLIETD